LELVVKPVDKFLEPGGETTVKIRVKDWNNKSIANAEVALLVVDESVLAVR
jgi:hypothetical protein